MGRISFPDATDLLRKLLTERIPVQAVFIGAFDTYFSLFGFVDSLTDDGALVVSESGPPIDVARGFVRFAFNIGCDFWYGEESELPPGIRDVIAGTRGDFALICRRTEPDERFILCFSL